MRKFYYKEKELCSLKATAQAHCFEVALETFFQFLHLDADTDDYQLRLAILNQNVPVWEFCYDDEIFYLSALDKTLSGDDLTKIAAQGKTYVTEEQMFLTPDKTLCFIKNEEDGWRIYYVVSLLNCSDVAEYYRMLGNEVEDVQPYHLLCPNNVRYYIWLVKILCNGQQKKIFHPLFFSEKTAVNKTAVIHHGLRHTIQNSLIATKHGAYYLRMKVPEIWYYEPLKKS